MITEYYMSSFDLEISNPCNKRCVHCYRVYDEKKRGFLSAAQVRNGFEQAKALGTTETTITGRELFLNHEWRDKARDELVDYYVDYIIEYYGGHKRAFLDKPVKVVW